MALTYGEYLKIDELLKLQKPLSEGEHDETLFIVIHQVYELWFKQILHEMGYLQKKFSENDTPQVLATFKRVLTILKTMVGQIDVLETMTPLSFLSFRTRLENSSGFQSVQFRRFEVALGKRSEKAQGNAPSLYDSFLYYLEASGYKIPASAHASGPSASTPESTEMQEILLDIYRKNPIAAQICERLVDLDEGIQEWRYRHVKMVERTIGFKMGSGGSSGAEYLRGTLFKPLFPDLWTIRTLF